MVTSFRSSVEPVLGTRLTMRVDCDDRDAASEAEREALAVADRLEAILSVFRADSPYNRWRRGLLPQPPPEVVEVLAVAASWHRRTDGAFNPCLGALMRRWRRAEAEQRLPDRAELAQLAADVAALPYDVDGDCILVHGDCRVVDVHGIAKGWVIDRMVEAALGMESVGAVLVDLGGDLRHASKTAGSLATVAVEDPFAVADNAAPLTAVRLANQAIATSGGGRRGWRIGGRWYGHLIDPVTGWPLPRQRSSAAVAESAADADAAASAFAALDHDRAEPLAERGRLAVLTVAEGGRVWRSAAWTGDVVERSVDGDPDQHERHDGQSPGGQQRTAPALALEDLDADPSHGHDEQQHR